ncbi:MAG: hypothetical protein LCH30_05570 [Proteobacteria bacterium]|nr:hypothetical protein [Pseudomonadota bacterium]
MKTTATLLLGLCISNFAQAKALSCNYRDYFRLSSDTKPELFVTKGSYTPEIFLGLVSPRSFEIRDARCTTGYAHITLVDNKNNWCILDIKDGPYMVHPDVQASCQGLVYRGTTYDGFRSFSYTISIG